MRRERDAGDRRRVVLAVTETAATRSLAAVRPLTDSVASITDELDEPARRAVADYLGQVAEVMRTFTGNEPVAQHAATETGVAEHRNGGQR